MVRQERNPKRGQMLHWKPSGTLLPMIGTEGKVVLAVTSDSNDIIVDVWKEVCMRLDPTAD